MIDVLLALFTIGLFGLAGWLIGREQKRRERLTPEERKAEEKIDREMQIW